MVKQLAKLDQLDLKILSILQRVGRISNIELAEQVGLSPSPCLTRVRRLEKAGYICGYQAVINMPKIVDLISVYAEITLSDRSANYTTKFEAGIRKIDEVTECHLVSSRYDYLVKFVTTNLSSYQALMDRLLQMNIGISKYFTYVVMKSPLNRRDMSLGLLVERAD